MAAGTSDRIADAGRRAIRELVRLNSVTDPLAARFRDAGYELYLVGGPVRDALLGREIDDLDFTTDARPDQILEVVRSVGATWTTGMAFGTVGVQFADWRCEITTYRRDVYDPSSRKPEVDFGDTIDEDLLRRDFSVNAMAIALPLDSARPIVDPSGGLDDLAERLLRTPIAPQQSFSDDPLRMLRAARFAAQLGFTVEAGTLAAITEMTDRLEIVSAERKREEITKLILAPDPRLGLAILVETGMAERVLPEVARLRDTVDEHRRHKDVYAHTLTVLEQAIELEPDGPDLILRMAALLHDIGKPKTKSVDADGKVSFHHHEVVGASMTKTRLSELRYPKDVVEDVSRLVELHLRFHGYSDGIWTDAAVRRYVRDAGPLLDRLHRLTRSDCTTRNARKAAALASAYDSLEQRIADLAEQEELASIRPDLDGNDIMAILGVPPGPVVGKASRHLLELRLERGPMERDEAIAALREWVAEQGA